MTVLSGEREQSATILQAMQQKVILESEEEEEAETRRPSLQPDPCSSSPPVHQFVVPCSSGLSSRYPGYTDCYSSSPMNSHLILPHGSPYSRYRKQTPSLPSVPDSLTNSQNSLPTLPLQPIDTRPNPSLTNSERSFSGPVTVQPDPAERWPSPMKRAITVSLVRAPSQSGLQPPNVMVPANAIQAATLQSPLTRSPYRSPFRR